MNGWLVIGSMFAALFVTLFIIGWLQLDQQPEGSSHEGDQ